MLLRLPRARRRQRSPVLWLNKQMFDERRRPWLKGPDSLAFPYVQLDDSEEVFLDSLFWPVLFLSGRAFLLAVKVWL
jgi:hypothetical protein